MCPSYPRQVCTSLALLLIPATAYLSASTHGHAVGIEIRAEAVDSVTYNRCPALAGSIRVLVACSCNSAAALNPLCDLQSYVAYV